MSQTKAQRFWWLIYWLFLVVSFCVISFLMITQAMGYRYNPHQRAYQKTGMIIVSNPPEGSILTLEGVDYPLRSTTRVPNVLPGTYRLVISKEGYQNWEKTVSIAPGFVVNVEKVSLYYKTPIEIADPAQYINLVPFYSVRDSRLRLEDGEIWFDSRLVSRFDTAPSDALVLPNDHIAYLRGDEVRVIESSGENDQLLYKRQTADATVFALVDDVLVFNDITGPKAIQFQ